jgi:EpsD family peptidyl-prolyl cis-trans isomerase
MNPRRLLIVSGVVLLAACERQSQSSAGEWVARWDSGSVSQAELDWGFQQAGKLDSEPPDKARARALESLINQKLIASAAERIGLARTPDVEFEEAFVRRQVLVRAFAETLGTHIPKPPSQTVADYYQRNPQLFSQRRVYQLQEIYVQANEAQSQAIRDQLSKSASLTEMAGWINEQDMHGTVMNGLKPAEQLPEAVRNQLAKMSVGQAALFPAKNGVTVVQVQHIEAHPLSLEQATPIIEKLLVAIKQKENFDTELRKLRDAVKIEYASGMQPAAKE